MATRRGHEVPDHDKTPRRSKSLEDLPDEWNFPGPWPDAEPDYVPKPGHKRYSPRDQMAEKPPPPKKPLDVNAIKARLWRLDNPGEMERPKGPSDTVHRHDDDEGPVYAQGGPVLKRTMPNYMKRKR